MLELKNFESMLQIRARELARSLAERNQIMIEQSTDEFDGRLQSADRERSAQALADGSRTLRLVEAARDRIRDGTFGVCLGCGAEIAMKRLQAIPWAALCVSCQEEEENMAFRPALGRAA